MNESCLDLFLHLLHFRIRFSFAFSLLFPFSYDLRIHVRGTELAGVLPCLLFLAKMRMTMDLDYLRSLHTHYDRRTSFVLSSNIQATWSLKACSVLLFNFSSSDETTSWLRERKKLICLILRLLTNTTTTDAIRLA